MTKQLSDIITTFSKLPYEERLAIIRRVRKNKYEVRPAIMLRKKKDTASKVQKENKKIQDLLKDLSTEEIAGIMASLGDS